VTCDLGVCHLTYARTGPEAQFLFPKGAILSELTQSINKHPKHASEESQIVVQGG
jgi:hypothetical protein